MADSIVNYLGITSIKENSLTFRALLPQTSQYLTGV